MSGMQRLTIQQDVPPGPVRREKRVEMWPERRLHGTGITSIPGDPHLLSTFAIALSANSPTC
jgi:hypothetical protein